MQDLAVGCGAGFSGDRIDAALPAVRSLIERGGPAALIFRTGAKGNRVNVGVFADADADFGWLAEQLTPERVKAPCARRRSTDVDRYLLPKLAAMNFVLDDVLDGGVDDTLHLDMHRKSLSFHLLMLPVQPPCKEIRP